MPYIIANSRGIASASGQQHLKLGEKDIKKTLRIQGGSKALFPDADPTAKASIFVASQSSFTQNIQVERVHIFTGPEGILVKDDIQTPVQLVLYRPMLVYRIGKTFHVGDRREKISGICCSFIAPADRGSHHAGSLQSIPFRRYGSQGRAASKRYSRRRRSSTCSSL